MKARIFDSMAFTYLTIIALIAILQPSQETYLNSDWSFLSVLLALTIGLLISFILPQLKIISLGEFIFHSPTQKKHIPKNPVTWYRTFWFYQLTILLIVTCVVGSQMIQMNLYELTDLDGLRGAKRILIGLLHPNWSILPQGIMSILETIFIAFMATILAVPLAFVMSFLSAKNVMASSVLGIFIYMTLRTIANIVRSIEPLIWAIIFTVWVGIGPFAGMLALMFHSVAALTKQYSELVECVEEELVEAILSTGAKPLQVVWFAIVPQVLLPYVSFTIYRWDVNVRMATLVGIMGGGGIGTMLMQYLGQALWSEVSTLTLLIVIAVWSLDTASAHIREAIK